MLIFLYNVVTKNSFATQVMQLNKEIFSILFLTLFTPVKSWPKRQKNYPQSKSTIIQRFKHIVFAPTNMMRRWKADHKGPVLPDFPTCRQMITQHKLPCLAPSGAREIFILHWFKYKVQVYIEMDLYKEKHIYLKVLNSKLISCSHLSLLEKWLKLMDSPLFSPLKPCY